MVGSDKQQRFRELHQRAMKAVLPPDERAEYNEAKEQFARSLCAAQGLRLEPGQRARATFRVLVLFKVEVTIDGSIQKAATMDVSVGGFSTLLGVAPATGTELPFKMSPSSKEAISGIAVVAGTVKERTGQLYRISFAFKDLPAGAAERLEEALIDAILARSQTAPLAFMAQGGRSSSSALPVAKPASSPSVPIVRPQSSGTLRPFSVPAEGPHPLPSAPSPPEKPPAPPAENPPPPSLPTDPDKTWDGEPRPGSALADALAATIVASPAESPQKTMPDVAPDAGASSVNAVVSTPPETATSEGSLELPRGSSRFRRLRSSTMLQVVGAGAALVAVVAIGGNLLARHTSAASGAPPPVLAAKPPPPPVVPETASVPAVVRAPEPAAAKAPDPGGRETARAPVLPAREPAPAKAPEPAVAKAPEPAAAPATVPAAGMGTLHVKVAGHRVFVDGRYVGDGPGTFEVKCGARYVRIGSHGTNRPVQVACGGDVVLTKR